MTTLVDPRSPQAVGEALLEELRRLLSREGLAFAEPPAPLGNGFDTLIYSFRLEPADIPPAWAAPLVLRVYTSASQEEKAQREAAVQEFVAARGYPAPAPLVVTGADSAFALPLMVLPRIDGGPLLERITSRPWRAPALLAGMAHLHAALHRLPVAGCPLPGERPLVERRLDEFRDRMEHAHVDGAADGLDWLERNKAAVAGETVSLCHNDFHPLNVLVDRGGSMSVIDWSDAALGDRHHDVARTLTLFWYAAVAARNSIERLLLVGVRGFLARRYAGPYARALPLDERRLRYWRAWQAFHGWLGLAEMRANPLPDVRPESLARLPAGLEENARRYYLKRRKIAEAGERRR
jgi:aminoglycoside phosphotransferase (APT) family kinase protein